MSLSNTLFEQVTEVFKGELTWQTELLVERMCGFVVKYLKSPKLNNNLKSQESLLIFKISSYIYIYIYIENIKYYIIQN